VNYKTIFDAIGNTPLVRLNKIVPNPLATVLLKLEFLNPSGSIKDRIVWHIISEAEKEGLLKPGGTIVENTSGNTGAAAAMIGAAKGYNVILTMPDKVSLEKQNALKAYGAKIVVLPTSALPDSKDHYVNKAKEIAADIPGSFRIDQYDNIKNPEAHYLTTGPEIWEQTQGNIDYYVSSGSTGGSISGVGKYLKEQRSSIQVILPDPKGSIYYSYFKTGKIPHDATCSYKLEGIGEDHIAKAIDFSVIDDVVIVDDKEAFAMCRKLCRKEGILAGGSTGANLVVALKIAKEAKKPITIVTLAPDSGVKYLSKIFNDEWMKEQNLL